MTALEQYSIKLADKEHYQSREVIIEMLAIGPAISNAGESINTLAQYNGYSYWQRFYPQEVNKERSIYVNSLLLPSGMLMHQGEWEEAIELLLPLATALQGKQGAKAAYNLAIAYEAMGRLQEAAHWAALSESKRNKRAKVLLAELKGYK